MPRNVSSDVSRIAADAVLTLHVLVAVYAVVGAFAILANPIYALIHVPLVLWVSIVNLADWTCPLTPLEQRLRLRAGQASYEESWIQHYCEPLIRPLGMPRRLELIAGTSILVWNIAVYAGLFWVLSR